MECLAFILILFVLSLLLPDNQDLPTPEPYDFDYYDHDVSGLFEEE